MGAQIMNVPGFEGAIFKVNFPESIGATDQSRWFDVIKCSWQELGNGDWAGRA